MGPSRSRANHGSVMWGGGSVEGSPDPLDEHGQAPGHPRGDPVEHRARGAVDQMTEQVADPGMEGTMVTTPRRRPPSRRSPRPRWPRRGRLRSRGPAWAQGWWSRPSTFQSSSCQTKPTVSVCQTCRATAAPLTAMTEHRPHLDADPVGRRILGVGSQGVLPPGEVTGGVAPWRPVRRTGRRVAGRSSRSAMGRTSRS